VIPVAGAFCVCAGLCINKRLTKIYPQYLAKYANHPAWLEDNRRIDNGELAHMLVAKAMEAPVSRSSKGYCQRAV